VTEQTITCVHVQRKLWAVGLADKHGPSVFEAPHHWCACAWHMPLEQQTSGRRPYAAGRDIVLYRKRDTVQHRSASLAACPVVAFLRSRDRSVGDESHYCVEAWIFSLDLVQRGGY
jgi:hypothetical protein